MLMKPLLENFFEQFSKQLFLATYFLQAFFDNLFFGKLIWKTFSTLLEEHFELCWGNILNFAGGTPANHAGGTRPHHAGELALGPRGNRAVRASGTKPPTEKIKWNPNQNEQQNVMVVICRRFAPNCFNAKSLFGDTLN